MQIWLFHQGYLVEQPGQVAAIGPATGTWLYRQIATEAGDMARIIGDYITETERHSGALLKPQRPPRDTSYREPGDPTGRPGRPHRVRSDSPAA